MKIIGFAWYLGLNDSPSNSAWVSVSMPFVINHSKEKQSELSPQSTWITLLKKNAPWKLVTSTVIFLCLLYVHLQTKPQAVYLVSLSVFNKLFSS